MKYIQIQVARVCALLMLAALNLVQANNAAAPLNTSYDLSWFAVAGGGGSSAGTGYVLAGTVGQPDAGPGPSAGGYTLAGGFWAGAAVQSPNYRVYLPLAGR